MESSEYQTSTFFIDSKSDVVVKLAQKLSKGQTEKTDIAISVFNYVRDNIKYTIDITQYDGPDDMTASKTIEKKAGFCIPKSVALVALLRANQLPSRLHFADIINHRIPPHLLELLKTNVMVLCQENRFIPVEFDGKNDATFKPFDNAGNRFVEYIKDRGVYADLPYEEIFSKFHEFYGYPNAQRSWSL